MKSKQWTHIVGKLDERQRIVDYCGDVFPILGSKSATKKALKDRRIHLNNKIARPSDFVRMGDQIKLLAKHTRVKRYHLEIPTVYEDDHLLIINKPGGIAVNGNRFKTVENVFANHIMSNSRPDALGRPIAVHRIDVPTKGLVVLAKTKTAQIAVGKAFQNNRVNKTYFAVVHGKTLDEGEINSAIDDKIALTKYKTLDVVPSKNYEHLSLVELRPQTGRTHQLRIHMKRIGNLILGDKQYAQQQKTILGKGLFLQAKGLSFKHPITQKQLEISLPIPDKFKKVMQRELTRYKRQ